MVIGKVGSNCSIAKQIKPAESQAEFGGFAKTGSRKILIA